MTRFRLLLLLLIVALGASLAACGGGDDDDGEPGVCDPPATEGPVPTGAPAVAPGVNGDITTTESGLTYVDVCIGSGVEPNDQSQVSVYYTGYLQSTGEKFDSSVDRGEPAVFSIDGVIPGFAEGLLSMKEGGMRRLIIPAGLAYGEQGSGDVIPPNSILIFDVQLVAVFD